MYSDQTPSQRKLMLNLQKELAHRIQNGEPNLVIKYVKGIPKIMKDESKNETPHARQPQIK